MGVLCVDPSHTKTEIHFTDHNYGHIIEAYCGNLISLLKLTNLNYLKIQLKTIRLKKST